MHYCRELLVAGTRYMVVDCGGGTVDITVHELVSVNRPVAELHKVCGTPFGSTGALVIATVTACQYVDIVSAI